MGRPFVTNILWKRKATLDKAIDWYPFKVKYENRILMILEMIFLLSTVYPMLGPLVPILIAIFSTNVTSGT